jgi:hypothetical protein
MRPAAPDAFFNFHFWGAFLEARGGIEPPIKVLQTFALPLGDRASVTTAFYQMIPCIVLERHFPNFDTSPSIDFRLVV